jgi:hypothetical protein
MQNSILIGRQEKIISMPDDLWRHHLANALHHSSSRLSFMTDDHRRIRNFVASELPRNAGKPLAAEAISNRLKIPLERVVEILAELQKRLFFLVLNDVGEVSWAFPVTTDKTPHRLAFSTGESIFAACGDDAIATPFVQGRLRNEPLVVEIESECAHCGRPLHFSVSSALEWNVREHEANPLVFEPDVDFSHLTAPNIIADY